MALGSCGDEVVVTEECITLDDPEAECPSDAEAAESFATDGDVTLVARYEARTIVQDGEEHELPAECCYEIETVQPSFSMPSHCGMGRPYVQGGAPRVAAPDPRGGLAWSRPRGRREAEGAAPQRLHRATLDAATRTLLASRWRERAFLEHASVASFAQFTLELMQLGAPASLVRASMAAGLSEVRHAELCFALAHDFDGADIGPGRLAAAPAAQPITKEALTARLFHDACVEETLGALELADRELVVEEPAVATVLSRLVADELKHAELAWRTLAWLCRDAGCREVLLRELDVARDRLAHMAVPEDDTPPSLAAFGELRATDRAASMQRAFDEVIAPCAASLVRRHAA